MLNFLSIVPLGNLELRIAYKRLTKRRLSLFGGLSLAMQSICGCVFSFDLLSKVNHLLERGEKEFVKTITCYPQLTTEKLYVDMSAELLDSEKVSFRFEWTTGCFYS